MNEGPNNAERLRRSVGYLMPRLDYTPAVSGGGPTIAVGEPILPRFAQLSEVRRRQGIAAASCPLSLLAWRQSVVAVCTWGLWAFISGGFHL